jgi:hypothetical protein
MVAESRANPGRRKNMLVKVTLVAWMGLMAASFMLGLVSLFFASPKTIWKALGLWGLGLGAGIAAVFLSFQILALQGQERATMIAAGKHVPLNDMPGFGQALLAAFGAMYYAALLAIIGLGFTIGMVRQRLALKQQRVPERGAR